MTIKFSIEHHFFVRNDLNDSQVTEQLNRLGDQGWELVSLVPITEGAGHTTFVSAFLKRQHS